MKLTTIESGLFKLDGGAMFGVVPKRIWEKLNPPDDQNMCTWALRNLLAETADGRKILFDTGIGNKQDAKWRSHFEPHGEANLLGSLAAAGHRPEDITDVFLTHLHFDHCGAALTRDEVSGEIRPTFPNAVYWSNQRHFDWACKPNAREKASFLAENFVPLAEMGRLRFLEIRQNVEFAPGIRVRFVNGHTEAMMVPHIQTERGTVVFCADLLPSRWHVGMPYVMAYDIRPLVSLREKARLVAEAARHRHLLFLEHDPGAEVATLADLGGGKIGLDRVGRLAEILG